MQVSSYLFQSPYSQAVQVGRPDPVQEQKQATEEQSEKSKDKDNLLDQESSSSQNDPVGINVKSSTMYQNDISSKSTSEAVNTLIAVAKDAGRSENIKAYVNN
ncbi:MAG: hypothetical protein Q8M39_05980 [Sulfuricurvum sp.]|nr:hypothetical protein [Sulfuricurvum sp.]